METKSAIEMRANAQKLIYLCNVYDKCDEQMFTSENTRSFERSQRSLNATAAAIENLMGDMIRNLNVLLCSADVIDIRDFYMLKKVRFSD